MAAACGLSSGKTVGLSPQICEKFGPNLDTCPEGTVLGLRLDGSGGLHLHVNGMDQGVAVPDVPQPCHALVDLYGQCEQVSRLPAGCRWRRGVWGGWVSLLTPLLQVTILSPEPGATSGKSAGTQGDMEKADMVDGEAAPRSPIARPRCPRCPCSCDPAPFRPQASRRVCAGALCPPPAL